MQEVKADSAKSSLNIEKLAYRLNEAQAVSGLSRSTLYELIAAKRLDSVKVGGRRLALAAAKHVDLAMQFLTLTVPHAPNTPLATSMDALDEAWKASRSGAAYRRLRSEIGLCGVVNVIDVTHGGFGWHLHIHSVLFAASDSAAFACAESLSQRYGDALAKSGWAMNRLTVDFRPVHDAQGLADYLSRSWHRPVAGGLTPFGLLFAAHRGCLRSGERFFEAVDAFRNKPRGAVSPRLARILRDGHA